MAAVKQSLCISTVLYLTNTNFNVTKRAVPKQSGCIEKLTSPWNYVILASDSRDTILLAGSEVNIVFSTWRSASALEPELLQFPARAAQCIQRRETTLCVVPGLRRNCIYSGTETTRMPLL